MTDCGAIAANCVCRNEAGHDSGESPSPHACGVVGAEGNSCQGMWDGDYNNPATFAVVRYPTGEPLTPQAMFRILGVIPA